MINLENIKQPTNQLHLRNLGLTSSEVMAIAQALSEGTTGKKNALRSVSFSYNPLLGDRGAIALAKAFPPSIVEIGLVNCSIGDPGGKELLEWAKRARNLRMICIEQNNFSENLKMEFRKFSHNHPHIMVVV